MNEKPSALGWLRALEDEARMRPLLKLWRKTVPPTRRVPVFTPAQPLHDAVTDMGRGWKEAMAWRQDHGDEEE
jgi:hypothetical protein